MTETPENDLQKLNPQIASATIGKRYLREIKIYPLSLGDQLKMTDFISQGISVFAQSEDQSDLAAVGTFVSLIQTNLPTLLKMVTDEDADILDEITNVQASAIAEKIWEDNYKSIEKNLKSLAGKLGSLFLSERPLPPSASDTDIPSETVSSPSEKAA